MKIGFFGAGVGGMVSRDAGGVATYAEELGYSSIWTGEHMVLPDERPEYMKIARDWAFADPMVMLGFLAGYTERIQLCTGVALIAQRNPVHFAKEAATLDVLSEGRLVLGVGVGHLEGEMRAIGLDPRHRVARSLEYLDAMRNLWTSDAPAFHGEFVSFADVTAFPRPLQPGGPRIVMGGASAQAYRRAVQHAAGWYGWDCSPEGAAAVRAQMKAVADELGRDLDDFEISISPLARLNESLVQEYADAGVDQLVVVVEADDVDGARRRLAYNAPEELGVRPLPA
jgi:probable F420-dependent oxidoreductase